LHELYVASRREGRLHSGKIQINLVFPLICSTFHITISTSLYP
jgi:hypothetical protein